MKRGAVLGGVVVLAVIGAALAVFTGDHTDSSIADVVACTNRRDFVECSRPHVRALLQDASAKDLIADVEALELPANQCHYLLHLIGQDIYARLGSVEEAIRECTHACNSACPHGAIGEAFSDVLGLGSGEDLGHLTGEEIRAMGEDLCGFDPAGILLSETAKGTCHGAGHALFLAYQDFDSSLQACADISPPIQESACYRGVYMEYTDLLSARSTWQDEYEEIYEPAPSELNDLCVRADIQESAACYYYLPIAVRQVYQKAGVTTTREDAAMKSRDICLALDDSAQRQACLLGYGVTLYATFIEDPRAAARTCLAFDGDADQESCIAGTISLVVEYGEFERAVGYCRDLDDVQLRSVCFGALFERLETLVGRSVDDALPWCPAGEMLCAERAEAVRAGERRFFAPVHVGQQ